MSAKIKIECADPALATALGMLIAKAVVEAGFTKTRTKLVMVDTKNTADSTFDRTSKLLGEYRVDLADRAVFLPNLDQMYFAIANRDDNIVELIAKRNPGMMDKPIVLDMFPDTCEKYEQAEKAFLADE